MSTRRCAVMRACMTDSFWRGCPDRVVRTAFSTGPSSDSWIGCLDLLPSTCETVMTASSPRDPEPAPHQLAAGSNRGYRARASRAATRVCAPRRPDGRSRRTRPLSGAQDLLS